MGEVPAGLGLDRRGDREQGRPCRIGVAADQDIVGP